MKFRLATLDDSVALSELAEDSFRKAWSEMLSKEHMESYVEKSFSFDSIEKQIADTENSFLLGEDEKGLLAYCKLRRGSWPGVEGDNPVEINRFYLNPNRIGKGLGRVLFEESIKRARENGHDVIWLMVWTKNENANAFYRHMGFEEVELIDRPFENTTLPHWVLQYKV